MGNPTGPQPPQSAMAVHQQSSASSITHFSHPHPLFLSQQGSNNTHCSGCKQFDSSSGAIYTCNSCNYSLHQKCSQMPQTITHPCDKNNHVLSLLTKPAYPDGTFTCDACGQLGYGFNYHCQACGIDIHTLCASSPMVINHPSHVHQLNLVFSPPYPMGIFSCDVCGSGGSKNWLYHCRICSFDVHLTCVNKPSNPHLVHQQSLPNPQLHQPLMTRLASVPGSQNAPIRPNNFAAAPGQYNSFPAANPGGFQQFQPHPQAMSRVAVSPAIPYAGPPGQPSMYHGGYNYGPPPSTFAAYGPQQQGMGSQLANSAMNGVASGVGQAVGTEMIQAMFGGGGGNSGGGGGGNDPTGNYNAGADGYQMDQGGYDPTGNYNGGADLYPVDQGQYFDGSYSQVDGSGDQYSGADYSC